MARQHQNKNILVFASPALPIFTPLSRTGLATSSDFSLLGHSILLHDQCYTLISIAGLTPCCSRCRQVSSRVFKARADSCRRRLLLIISLAMSCEACRTIPPVTPQGYTPNGRYETIAGLNTCESIAHIADRSCGLNSIAIQMSPVIQPQPLALLMCTTFSGSPTRLCKVQTF